VLTAIALGFLVGTRHAFDPDHGFAVSSIAARQRNPWMLSWIGVSWGLGHGLRLLAAGFAMIAPGVALIFEFAFAQGDALTD
jgi:high-affinity nickel permease